MLPGFASEAGTARYRDRFPRLRQAGHFRRQEHVPGAGELWISSLGLGTYLGEADEPADRRYTEAIEQALRSGVNLLDTAINYRHQRSERNIGKALGNLMAAGELARDEVVICTKAGYLSFDGSLPADPRAYFQKEYVEPGILNPAEIAGGMHCMAPRYLDDQLERCRRNLDLETIDVFYVHNPESQLGDVSMEALRRRLTEAFVFLEKAVAAGRIRYYGCATWNAFRAAPGQRDAISLAETLDLARQAGGDQHHFRFVQLPFNLGMPEAYAFRNQKWEGEPVSTLELAQHAGIAVVGSATLHQGQLTDGLPEFIAQKLGMASDAENAIQFARSAPGLAAALVGMGRKEHVAANLKVAAHPIADVESWKSLFRKD
jgi:aryl-alcohol dehydrogenase-like predicted oxidoreductase